MKHYWNDGNVTHSCEVQPTGLYAVQQPLAWAKCAGSNPQAKPGSLDVPSGQLYVMRYEPGEEETDQTTCPYCNQGT